MSGLSQESTISKTHLHTEDFEKTRKRAEVYQQICKAANIFLQLRVILLSKKLIIRKLDSCMAKNS